MTDLQRRTGLVSAVLVAIVNALVGFGVIPLDTTGTALLNTTISSLAGFVLYLLRPDNA